ncbi:MAG: hypothetical protein ACOYMG_24815 [Candidatus Methylumidiphilus sp.]
MATLSPSRIVSTQKFIWATIYLVTILFVATLLLWIVPLVLNIYTTHDIASDLINNLNLSNLGNAAVKVAKKYMEDKMVNIFGYYLLIPFAIGGGSSIAWSMLYQRSRSTAICTPLDANDAAHSFRFMWFGTLLISVAVYVYVVLVEIKAVLSNASHAVVNAATDAAAATAATIGGGIGKVTAPIIQFLGQQIDATPLTGLLFGIAQQMLVSVDWLIFMLSLLLIVILVHGLAMLAFSVILRGAHRVFPCVSLPVALGGMVLTSLVQGLVRLSAGALDAAAGNRFHDLGHEMWTREGRK